ncbi:MAG: hypothetical protein ACI808_000758 [Paraglaciecola sp.]|jgi:hypothetical protein
MDTHVNPENYTYISYMVIYINLDIAVIMDVLLMLQELIAAKRHFPVYKTSL